MLSVAGTTSLTSCDNNWEYPPMVVPTATIEANTTIAQLKADFFQAGVYNYSTTVGTKADGTHYIIEGYVSSSDESGNIFKKVYIEDATGGIYIGIDAYDLYQSYKPGQKVVMDVTGLAVGGYGGAMNIGLLNASGAPNRIPTDEVEKYAQVDGLPGVETQVQPMEISLGDISKISPLTTEGLAYVNRLVRINGVKFQNAGKQTLSTSGSSGVSQTFSNDQGSAVLYTSGYSDFWDYYCPTGTGDIIGILGCYGATWQMVLIDINGLVGFDELEKAPSAGNPGDVPDTPAEPGDDGVYSVAAAIALINSGNIPSQSVRVRGVVSSITELSTSYGNATYEIKDALTDSYSLTVYRGKYIDGASFTSENQLEVGATVVVEGSLELYGGKTPEISTGSKIISYTDPNGNTVGGSDNPGGNDTPGGDVAGAGTQDNPYNVAAVIGGATGTEVWVKGYIVGWVEGQVLKDGAHFDANNVSVATNLLISDNPNAASLDEAVPVQLPSGDVRTALNLQNNPSNLGKEVLLKGNLEKYFGVAGVKTVTQYVFVNQE